MHEDCLSLNVWTPLNPGMARLHWMYMTPQSWWLKCGNGKCKAAGSALSTEIDKGEHKGVWRRFKAIHDILGILRCCECFPSVAVSFGRELFQPCDPAFSKPVDELAVDCGCPTPRTKRALGLACLQDLEHKKFCHTEQCWRAYRKQMDGKAESYIFTKSSWIYFDVPFKAVIDGHMIPKRPKEMLPAAFQEQLRSNRELLLVFNNSEALLPKATSETSDSPTAPEELMRRLDEICG
ncbi:hypothetical protein CSKR_114233 [Clonorchis sinensis]|uniref:Uncharacterized protein n=1 Tax=Clonorchis sinensis TaxID=79923 RepID=A0A3R7G041_CLOSI|nr:hypothetical protein CSKR_114233 [Clonorchis sinensis]